MLIGIIATTLSACAGQGIKDEELVKNLATSGGNIFIQRSGNFVGSGCVLDISLTSVPDFTLGIGETMVFKLPTGEYEINTHTRCPFDMNAETSTANYLNSKQTTEFYHDANSKTNIGLDMKLGMLEPGVVIDMKLGMLEPGVVIDSE